MKKEITKNGFSLIELLVVLGIIAVLTGLVAFNFNTARMRARDVQRKNDLKELRTAMELYKNDNRQLYPSSGTYPTFPQLVAALNAAGYIPSTVTDPKLALTGDASSWDEYTYESLSPFTSYTITICLENRADSILAESTLDCGPAGIGRLYSFTSQ